MDDRALKIALALLGFVCLDPLWLRADLRSIPVARAQVEEDPYKFNGVLIADLELEGSGAVVRHPNIVLSCAHIVYTKEELLDPWIEEVRWFWKHHASAAPSWADGKRLRGYTRFSSYQYIAEAHDAPSPKLYNWDIVAHFAYEPLAGGEYGEWWTNGLAGLTASSSKMGAGYPSGLYPEGHPNEYELHVTGPFSMPFQVEHDAYLEVEGVTTGPGNSGGPIWVQDSSGAWLAAGVIVTASQKAQGASINRMGVRAMDANAWALVTEAMGTTPPLNDQFRSPLVFGGATDRVTGSNVGATKEANEPDHADEPGGRSVWWTWTAPANATATFDTVGTTFDTVLAVYTGNAVSNLTLVKSDDDSGAEDGTSRVTFAAQAGTVYHIAVDGYESASGQIVLNILPLPPNDDFADRLVLTGTPRGVMGSNVGATKETGEPNHAGRLGGKSVWWAWTAPATGTATIDTAGSEFDTLLAVYTGGPVSSLTRVASNNDSGGNVTSSVTFAAVAGVSYHIAVDGSGGESGRIVLNIWQGLQIKTHPVSQSVMLGGYAPFKVTLMGGSSASYQWRKDDRDIVGATNSSLVLTNVQTTQAGVYSVLVKNAAGSVISSNAMLTVTIPYTFVTWAGTPRHGSADGRGSAARFWGPTGIAVDRAGNIYVADSGNDTIRRIRPDGTVSTLAGTADNLPGSVDGIGGAARFRFPTGVTVDNAGNVYVADTLNNTIRKVTANGTVSTFAGSTRNLPGSADGIGTAARFFAPNRLSADRLGNVYVADTLNHTIRKITLDGLVTTVAGSAGIRGSADGIGNVARFAYPRSTAVDAFGNIYVADSGNATIRKITSAGLVTTVAGSAGNGGSADGMGNQALFSDPAGIAVDGIGAIYVADDYTHTIRKITPDGIVSTLAGLAGQSGSADGLGTLARFNVPIGLALDRVSNIYVADSGNHTIRKITPDGAVTTIAGKASIGSKDGIANTALFASPDGPAVDLAGNVYVADNENHTIRKITPEGLVSTLAGLTGVAGSADGKGNEARFFQPESPAVDQRGNLYVADAYNHTIRKVTPDGVVTTLAGAAGSYGSTDGRGSAARFFYPFGVALDRAGNVYVADGYNHTIRKITPDGVVSTLAGSAGAFGHADGVRSAARFNGPESVAVDQANNIYVADFANHVIRKISPEGVVSTLAGSPGIPGSTDGPGNVALFDNPISVTVDGTGQVYVADARNHTIRMITPDGVVSTLAGSALERSGSTDGVAGQSRFNFPSGVAVDSAGNLYVADLGNNTLRKGLPFAITTQPQNQTKVAGASVIFSVGAVSSVPLAYQWRRDGVNLPGATNSTFTIPNVQGLHTGAYNVLVSNNAGILTSSNILLRVVVPQHLELPQRLADGRVRLLFHNSDGGLPPDLTRLELQWRTELPRGNDTNWQTVTSGFYLLNGRVAFDDPLAAGQPQRFYRVVER